MQQQASATHMNSYNTLVGCDSLLLSQLDGSLYTQAVEAQLQLAMVLLLE
jgi:hypothetical protein